VPRRTTLLQASVVASGLTLALIGLVPRFPVAVGLLVVWGLLFATVTPIRQAYLNKLIPSEQRATGLSFDSLMGSAGGVGAQPLLGKAADVWGYPASYLCCATIQLMAAPFIWLVRRERPDL
jgi:MFS family permease